MPKQIQEVKQEPKGVVFEYKLYNLFNSIKHLDSVNIKATEKGLDFWGMDLSNTMMTEVFIDKEHIRNYQLKKPTEITTEIDYLRIVKRLYMVKAYIDEQKMIFEEKNTKIEMPVLETSQKEKPKLDLKKAVSFELSPSEVRKALNDITAIGSDVFYLEFKDKSAVFRASGKYGTLIKTLEPYEKGIKKFEKKAESIKVSLSVELFRNALNGSQGKMRITLSENSPVIVEYIGSEYDRLTEKVTHYIAPRVDDNDDFEYDDDEQDDEQDDEAVEEIDTEED